ncbi:MAG: cytochrome C [Zetaproteobacteria bacterium CG12_big_fil_rev_8_21_14_0_65_54_13]|nr:MAG: cytochrome C [Zetaproteobacteria bacterium CG12_big_fil_rev_8_21_14_0_65_54_13]PIX54923.1 MAG: cytochrome C [Zetaproteobacteria bacterium CG_4_10_14_3_um_filter_54_28]PJA31080.1 MAG: cytochrome C [Zetaproteobacteria bacterium CG_4_9_14_3_um_filter_54_145]
MKRSMIVFGVLCSAGISVAAYAKDHEAMGNMAHHQMMQDTNADQRISLQLTPQMKQHQLANMRSHVEAVQSIIGMLAENKFNEASAVAHNQLGLTPEMRKMCNMFGNDDFRKMGLAFHQSADELGDTLKTGDMSLSLKALHRTMNSCVQCHATFRQ